MRKEEFSTRCPHCNVEYQYERKFVNTLLSCLYCRKKFMRYEIGGSKRVSPNSRHEPNRPELGAKVYGDLNSKDTDICGIKKGVEFITETNAVLSDPTKESLYDGKSAPVNPALHRPSRNAQFQNDVFAGQNRHQATKSRACFEKEEFWTRCPYCITEYQYDRKFVNTLLRCLYCRRKFRSYEIDGKETGSCDINPLSGIKKGEKWNGDLKNKTKNVPYESKLENVTRKDNFLDLVTDLDSDSSRVCFEQRSSRKRQFVFCNESLDLAKRSQAHKLSEENENELKDAFTRVDSNHGNRNTCPVDTIEIESDSDSDPHCNDNPDEGISVCYEYEFNDFNKNRDETCFAVDQCWALYDNVDGMPRFYAKVKKVHTSPFELTMTWLDSDPINHRYSKWVEEGLPAGCGRFKHGKTEKTSIRLTFSHQVICEKGDKKDSIIIYPRKGEIWAIFKDWHMSWMFETENRKTFKYEIVEVLADFDSVAGIKVCYLSKVRRFVSLFRRCKTKSFLIGPNELYKFSHLVPSVRMRGTERDGVPVGSFELNPTCLPLNPDDLYYPGKAKMENENVV